MFRGDASAAHMTNMNVIRQNVKAVSSHAFQYWHFGIFCKSLSTLVMCNGGTRTKAHALGVDPLPVEVERNQMLSCVVKLLDAMMSFSASFTVLNPRASYLWVTP